MNNLLYIQDNRYNLIVQTEDTRHQINELLNKYLHQLCLKEHTTLKGRLQAIKELYGFKYNPPIYINNHIILVKIVDWNNIYYINVYNVVGLEKISHQQTKVIFSDQTVLVIKKSKRSISDQFKKGQLIINKTV